MLTLRQLKCTVLYNANLERGVIYLNGFGVVTKGFKVVLAMVIHVSTTLFIFVYIRGVKI